VGGAVVERPIDRRRAATRREILDAAWALCREHGLAGLSLRDLAARVGMRAPSLYSYFAAKDAIYDAMFAEGQRELSRQLATVDLDGGEPRERLRTALRAFFEFCTSDPVRYQLMFQRTLPGFEPSPESYALAVAQVDLLTSVLREAGVTDPRQVDLWTAMLTGLTAQQISNDPGGDRWGRLLDEAADMLCDHAGVPPARRPRRPR
jgi:AcrR family transcriptional regulator